MLTLSKFLISTSSIIMTILTLLMMMMTKKKKKNMNKSSPFECGFSPLSSPRKSFSIQFFFIAILFLIFDVEMSIILPMNFMSQFMIKEWMTTNILILIILIMGLLNEWNQNMIEWMN